LMIQHFKSELAACRQALAQLQHALSPAKIARASNSLNSLREVTPLSSRNRGVSERTRAVSDVDRRRLWQAYRHVRRKVCRSFIIRGASHGAM
jgi:hypothetical protein